MQREIDTGNVDGCWEAGCWVWRRFFDAEVAKHHHIPIGNIARRRLLLLNVGPHHHSPLTPLHTRIWSHEGEMEIISALSGPWKDNCTCLKCFDNCNISSLSHSQCAGSSARVELQLLPALSGSLDETLTMGNVSQSFSHPRVADISVNRRLTLSSLRPVYG